MRTLHLHNSISVKQILFLWLVLCLSPGLANATGKHFGSHHSKFDGKRYSDRHHHDGHHNKRCKKHCDNALTIPLLVDQNIQVGVVKVTFDEHRLNIKYVANDGWRIEKTHLAVADSFEGLPQDRYGNPKLRRFPYKTTHKKPVQTVNQMLSADRWPIGTELYIAAQASVIAQKPMHGGKSRFKAKSWSDKSSRHMKNSADYSSHYSADDVDNESNDNYSHSESSKSTNTKQFFQRFFYGKQTEEKHHHGIACMWGKKHTKKDKSSSKSKSAWAKGYEFPGNMEGYYCIYLLKPCKPV